MKKSRKTLLPGNETIRGAGHFLGWEKINNFWRAREGINSTFQPWSVFKLWDNQHAPLLKAISEPCFSWGYEGEEAFSGEDQWRYWSWHKAQSQRLVGLKEREVGSGGKLSTL